MSNINITKEEEFKNLNIRGERDNTLGISVKHGREDPASLVGEAPFDANDVEFMKNLNMDTPLMDEYGIGNDEYESNNDVSEEAYSHHDEQENYPVFGRNDAFERPSHPEPTFSRRQRPYQSHHTSFSRMEEKSKKAGYLYKLKILNKNNMDFIRSDMNSSLNDIEDEYIMTEKRVNTEAGTEALKSGFNAFAFLWENILTRQKLMKLNVENLHYDLILKSETPEYEKYFMAIYEEYFTSIEKINPVLLLAGAVISSTVGYHLSNSNGMKNAREKLSNPYEFDDPEDDIEETLRKMDSHSDTTSVAESSNMESVVSSIKEEEEEEEIVEVKPKKKRGRPRNTA